jgi:hypothetical protein
MRAAVRVMCVLSALGGTSAAAAAPPSSASSTTPAAAAEEPAAAPAAAPSDADNRLLFSGEGSWLTGDHGGAGGSITWLRNFGTGNVLGLGAEYQTVADSHWSTGNFNGSLSLGQGSWKTILYADAELGAGATGGESFRYTDIAGGFYLTPTSWLSVQLEERYLDIDKSYGNLPKLAVASRIVTGLVGTVSYAESFGGNLGTKLGTVRLDYFGKHLNWLAGAAYGPVAPALVNLIGQQLVPAQTLREGFVGVGKTFGRADWQLLGDYQDLQGFKRTTITLNCTLHLNAGRRQP